MTPIFPGRNPETSNVFPQSPKFLALRGVVVVVVVVWAGAKVKEVGTDGVY